MSRPSPLAVVFSSWPLPPIVQPADIRYFDPAHAVQPDQLITGVGCSAVLDQLFYTLMDEGEAVLLAAP